MSRRTPHGTTTRRLPSLRAHCHDPPLGTGTIQQGAIKPGGNVGDGFTRGRFHLLAHMQGSSILLGVKSPPVTIIPMHYRQWKDIPPCRLQASGRRMHPMCGPVGPSHDHDFVATFEPRHLAGKFLRKPHFNRRHRICNQGLSFELRRPPRKCPIFQFRPHRRPTHPHCRNRRNHEQHPGQDDSLPGRRARSNPILRFHHLLDSPTSVPHLTCNPGAQRHSRNHRHQSHQLMTRH